MQITGASIVNRELNKCESTMKRWSYRDPSNTKLNDNGPNMWGKLAEFSQCKAKEQSPIALSDSAQSSINYWNLNNRSHANASTIYSNAKDDRLQFDYRNVTA